MFIEVAAGVGLCVLVEAFLVLLFFGCFNNLLARAFWRSCKEVWVLIEDTLEKTLGPHEDLIEELLVSLNKLADQIERDGARQSSPLFGYDKDLTLCVLENVYKLTVVFINEAHDKLWDHEKIETSTETEMKTD